MDLIVLSVGISFVFFVLAAHPSNLFTEAASNSQLGGVTMSHIVAVHPAEREPDGG